MFLKSERLIIRAVKVSDAEFYFKLFKDPDWIKYIHDKGLNSVKETEHFLKEMIANNESKKTGYFTVLLKENNKPIGVSTALKRESLDYIDVGYAFLPEGRGKGYASEATKLMLSHIKKTFKQEKVLAFTKPGNKPSQKLLENLGFKFVGTESVFDGNTDNIFEYNF